MSIHLFNELHKLLQSFIVDEDLASSSALEIVLKKPAKYLPNVITELANLAGLGYWKPKKAWKA